MKKAVESIEVTKRVVDGSGERKVKSAVEDHRCNYPKEKKTNHSSQRRFLKCSDDNMHKDKVGSGGDERENDGVQ